MSYVKNPSSRVVKYVTTASATLVAAEGYDTVHFSGGTTATLNLPAIASMRHGDTLLISNRNSGDLTVDANSSETIGGSATLTVATNTAALLVADKTGTAQWEILMSYAT